MNIFAHCEARPFWRKSEQTRPAPPWSCCKLKAERRLTKEEGKQAGQKGKEAGLSFERADAETKRINRLCLSFLLLIPVKQLCTAAVKETAK